MRRSERQNHSSSVLEPSSRAPSLSPIDAPSPARVTLPSDLSGSLKYLDDAQLQRLLEAVTVEIDRRDQGAPKNETATAAATGTSSQRQSAAFRNTKTRGIDEFRKEQQISFGRRSGQGSSQRPLPARFEYPSP